MQQNRMLSAFQKLNNNDEKRFKHSVGVDGELNIGCDNFGTS